MVEHYAANQPFAALGFATPDIFVETDQDSPAFTSQSYIDMGLRWELITALMRGIDYIRLRGTRWIPMEPKERVLSYYVRLSRTFLYSMYTDAVDLLSCKPFQEQVKVESRVHESLSELEFDVDLEGTSITEFSLALLKDAIHRGLSHFLVDRARFEEGVTLADGIRAYFVHIRAEDMLGARVRKTASGEIVVSYIRYRTSVEEPSGRFGSVTRHLIREIFEAEPGEPGRWVEWVRLDEAKDTKSSSWRERDSGEHGFPGPGLPLVTLYTNRTGHLTGTPSLEGLAQLNLEHLQKSSDESNILRFVSIATLVMLGFDTDSIDAEEEKSEKSLGPNVVISSSNTEARAWYVEHTGAGIGVLQSKLRVLEQRGLHMGFQPMMVGGTPETATANFRADEKNTCALKTWTRSLEDALVQGYKFAHMFEGVEIPQERRFQVKVFSDFGISSEAQAKVDQLIKIRRDREIDRVTFLKALKRLAVLDEGDDVEGIIARVVAESRAAAAAAQAVTPALGRRDARAPVQEQDGSREQELSRVA